MERCRSCSRCNFVSFAFPRSCSWYEACNLQSANSRMQTTCTMRPGRVLPPPYQLVAVHHIPRTGGTSLHVDIKREIRGKEHRVEPYAHYLGETCLPELFPGVPRSLRFTMLRSPRQHVISQFMLCRGSDYARSVLVSGGFARKGMNGSLSGSFTGRFVDGIRPTDGLAAWVAHHLRQNRTAHRTSRQHWNASAGLYDPWNLQTRALSCQSKGMHSSHYGETSPTPRDAVTELGAANVVVGLTELYRVSLCVMIFRATGQLRRWCVCSESRSPAKAAQPSHLNRMSERSTNGRLSISDLPAATVHDIDLLTRLDKVVYAAAAQRLLGAIKAIERVGRVELLCSDEIAQLVAAAGYIPNISRLVASVLLR